MEDQENGASGAETVEDTVFLGLDVVEGGVSEDAVVVAQGGEGDTGQVVEGMGIVLHQDDDDGGDNEVPRGRRKSSKEETAEILKLAVAEYRDEMWSSIIDTSVTCSVSLQQLVEQTLAPEVREKRCDSCGHETATTTTTLVTLPRVMLLYLKRYKYMGTVGGASLGTGGQTTSRKLTRLVDIPDTVSMEKLVSDNVHVPDPVLSESLDINNHQMETEEVPEPETVSSSYLLPSTPVKNNCDNPVLPLTYEGLGTPIKF